MNHNSNSKNRQNKYIFGKTCKQLCGLEVNFRGLGFLERQNDGGGGKLRYEIYSENQPGRGCYMSHTYVILFTSKSTMLTISERTIQDILIYQCIV